MAEAEAGAGSGAGAAAPAAYPYRDSGERGADGLRAPRTWLSERGWPVVRVEKPDGSGAVYAELAPPLLYGTGEVAASRTFATTAVLEPSLARFGKQLRYLVPLAPRRVELSAGTGWWAVGDDGSSRFSVDTPRSERDRRISEAMELLATLLSEDAAVEHELDRRDAEQRAAEQRAAALAAALGAHLCSETASWSRPPGDAPDERDWGAVAGAALRWLAASPDTNYVPGRVRDAETGLETDG